MPITTPLGELDFFIDGEITEEYKIYELNDENLDGIYRIVIYFQPDGEVRGAGKLWVGQNKHCNVYDMSCK